MYAENQPLSNQMRVSGDLEKFVISHLQFVIMDRYIRYPKWIVEVLKSFLEETPLENTRVDPRFDRLLKETIGSLYEYCRLQKLDLTYAQYQSILRGYLNTLEEEDFDD